MLDTFVFVFMRNVAAHGQRWSDLVVVQLIEELDQQRVDLFWLLFRRAVADAG
ncbi:hypothetical protein D3C72_2589670 [compost metagenome]